MVKSKVRIWYFAVGVLALYLLWNAIFEFTVSLPLVLFIKRVRGRQYELRFTNFTPAAGAAALLELSSGSALCVSRTFHCETTSRPHQLESSIMWLCLFWAIRVNGPPLIGHVIYSWEVTDRILEIQRTTDHWSDLLFHCFTISLEIGKGNVIHTAICVCW